MKRFIDSLAQLLARKRPTELLRAKLVDCLNCYNDLVIQMLDGSSSQNRLRKRYLDSIDAYAETLKLYIAEYAAHNAQSPPPGKGIKHLQSYLEYLSDYSRSHRNAQKEISDALAISAGFYDAAYSAFSQLMDCTRTIYQAIHENGKLPILPEPIYFEPRLAFLAKLSKSQGQSELEQRIYAIRQSQDQRLENIRKQQKRLNDNGGANLIS
jgi:hypothetical protein